MKLNAEQERQLLIYKDKWIKINYSTEKANREYAEKSMQDAYEIVGLPKPINFEWFLSPFAAKQSLTNRGIKAEPFFYGCHSASWLSVYDYYLNVLNIELCRKLVPLMEVAKSCGWCSLYENIVFMQERPCELHFDVNYNLHNPLGPAILYRDGFAVYILNGVKVHDWVVTTPQETTDEKIGEKILGLTNVQERTEAVKKFGMSKIAFLLKSEKIDKFNNYELLAFYVNNNKIGPYLKMTNPSTGEIHIEGVGDLNNPWKIKTCKEALAWRMGFDEYI